MGIQASRSNAISLQIAIEEYFRDNNLDEEITDYDFGNGAFTEWHFYCDGDDFKYIDDNILYDYIADLREFRDENFEVFSFRDEISVKILDDEFEESKKSARKSIKESKETWEDIDGKFIYFKDDKYEIISQSNRYDYSHFEDVENWGFMILARKIKSKGNLETWAIFYGSETKFDYNYWDEDLAGETVDSYRSDAVYDIGSEDEIDEIWNEMN